jgi:hypothetical protein
VALKLNMSAGEFFDLVRPVAVLTSALISAWVLASARKRFSVAAALGWTIGTLLLPLVVLPIYLAVILVWRRPVRKPRYRFLVPLIYGAVVLVAISVYFYVNNQSVDAHLARATEAKLDDDTASAIREYRRALELEENPHTHKLLAIQLAQAGYLTDAISEFRWRRKAASRMRRCTSTLACCCRDSNRTDKRASSFRSFYSARDVSSLIRSVSRRASESK